jgi:hypothetical protein
MRATVLRILFLATALSAPASSGWAAKGGGETLPEGAKLNACGCYRGDDGTCRCVKKGKCACPGECEPVGCEQKRQKEMDKQAQNELKKIQDREKKRAAQEKKKGGKGKAPAASKKDDAAK